ncbi:hypothetical protein GALMADRAFT_135498 [Galerina marginata CBS 339.88]|uniref:AIG1-type G domain-containing protein n=1 Tax=Galerina marginata (strain CBS 339.88) TaxID=685588 RepID=A0A067TFZ4_GALM3|nr:hypothetical protein GALMADRAFT_135498 [Galerina marginata CBS 339.88]
MPRKKSTSWDNRKLKDIVIPVMGATGAGKSTFINTLLGYERMTVGHDLTSCTSKLQEVALDFPSGSHLEGYRLVVVDTPGFDDTYEGDAAILRRVAEWLEKSYRGKDVLGGVIYLHDISHDRFTGVARRNLEMFRAMCGSAAINKVVLGTTCWTRTSPEIGLRHEEEIERLHWSPLLKQGARMRQFQGTPESALGFIEDIVKRNSNHQLTDTVLQIQTELADDGKILPETEAGKHLHGTLQEVLKAQKEMAVLEASMASEGDPDAKAKLEETRAKIENLVRQVQELKIPLSRRLRSFFGL